MQKTLLTEIKDNKSRSKPKALLKLCLILSIIQIISNFVWFNIFKLQLPSFQDIKDAEQFLGSGFAGIVLGNFVVPAVFVSNYYDIIFTEEYTDDAVEFKKKQKFLLYNGAIIGLIISFVVFILSIFPFSQLTSFYALFINKQAFAFPGILYFCNLFIAFGFIGIGIVIYDIFLLITRHNEDRSDLIETPLASPFGSGLAFGALLLSSIWPLSWGPLYLGVCWLLTYLISVLPMVIYPAIVTTKPFLSRIWKWIFA